VIWAADHPAHRVLLCQGKVCQARGAFEIWQAWRRLARDGDGVALLRTSCLGQCPLGPMAVVYPEGVWLLRQTPAAAGQVFRALRGDGEWPTGAHRNRFEVPPDRRA
jgi:(2Fe-2S) ferredoxin